MNHAERTVALVALADLGITDHVGPDWARDEILSTLANFGCPAPPDGPAAHVILDVAAAHLDRALAASLPAGLTLIDSVICGPPETDVAALRRQAMNWRDRAGIAEIVARTGLWSPPSTAIMPTVRVEARADDITPDGHRIGELATRADAQYWAVYGVLPDGQLDLAADFATEDAARRYALRWQRPGVVVCADHAESLAPRANAVTPDQPHATRRLRLVSPAPRAGQPRGGSRTAFS